MFQKESHILQATFVITYPVKDDSGNGEGKVKRPIIILTSLHIDVQAPLAKK